MHSKPKKALGFLVAIGLLLSGTLAAQTGEKAEREKFTNFVKAALIFNITKQVNWPDEASFTSFKIVVLGSPELSDALEQFARSPKGKFRGSVQVQVTNVTNAASIVPCQILVVSGLDQSVLGAAYNKIKGKSTLMFADDNQDYKKAMISFKEVDGKMKYIVNKEKTDKANLLINQKVYNSAVSGETEWRQLFKKLKGIVANGNGSKVEVSKSELSEMLNMYSTMERQKETQRQFIEMLEDSMREKIKAYDEKMLELNKLNQKIQTTREILNEQAKKMMDQDVEISAKAKEIASAKNVITIIGSLTLVVLILLGLSIRNAYLRKKANQLLLSQKLEIEKQKKLVDEKQKEILDSIIYAKRIQNALVAGPQILSEHLGEHFMIYKPKDIVAGDFCWATPVQDGFIYVTGDSTGHGVPGAFTSLLNISKISETIESRKITRPDLVLNNVRHEIITALNPPGSIEECKDGMDCVMVKLNRHEMVLEYSAANNSFYIVRNDDIIVCKADKMPIGKSLDETRMFTYNRVQLERGDVIYTFTDGFGDQFGGPEGKKYKSKRLKDLLLSVSKKPLKQQADIINRTFEEWRGELEQVDDVLVMGVRV